MVVYSKDESDVKKSAPAEERPKTHAINCDAAGAKTNLGQGQEVRIATGMVGALTASPRLVGRRRQIPAVSIPARASSAAAAGGGGSLDHGNKTGHDGFVKISYEFGKTETLGFERRNGVSAIPPIGPCRWRQSIRNRVFDAIESKQDQRWRHSIDDDRESVTPNLVNQESVSADRIMRSFS